MEDKYYHIIRETIIQEFERAGFQWKIRNINETDSYLIHFTKEFPRNKKLVIVDVQSDPGRINLVINFIARIRLDLIEQYFPMELLKKVNDSRNEVYTIQPFGNFLKNERLHATEKILENFEDFVAGLKKFIKSEVLESFENYKTIQELDEVMNKEIDNTHPLWGQLAKFYKIVIAKLAGSEMYHKLLKSQYDIYYDLVSKEKYEPDRVYYEGCIDLLDYLSKTLKDATSVDQIVD
ncbi:MAG: hypothetical protein RIF39_02700 [Cyclobacteriaceae bacterium]